MDESHYYHAIAIAACGGYFAIKKCRAAGGGSWEAAYHAIKNGTLTLGENSKALPDPCAAYEYMESLGVRLILNAAPTFPDALRHIPYPPYGIYVRGGALPTTAIAIVGTRRASADGAKTARHFARELTTAGFTIVSGLAFGIDAAAHEGALETNGATVAVLAGGLDAVYPHSHSKLAQRMLDNGGALISEYPPGEDPFGYRFIERNRIISGISRGVLVVEAPESSGSLATARYAVEQNREVFVVPGSVHTTGYKGSHALIRQGAELVTSPSDILEAYGIDRKMVALMNRNASSPEETLILQALARTSNVIDVDKLVALTRLEPRMVNQTLSLLLIRGIVKESEGGYTI